MSFLYSIRATLAITLLSMALSTAAIAATTRVAAAASLQLAFKEILLLFKHDYPDYSLTVTYGSSGLLSSQIQQGAPFEIFFSADDKHVKHLETLGLLKEPPFVYAKGRLAFYTRETIAADTASAAIQNWLKQRHSATKLAVANPRHAPFGQAAESWLLNHQLLHEVERFLVQGENASQAVQFVISGAAAAGIVPWSLLKGREDLPGSVWLIPESEHIEMHQSVALLTQAEEGAQVFYDYVKLPKIQAILLEHGFGVP